jgi:hypothetical protein
MLGAPPCMGSPGVKEVNVHGIHGFMLNSFIDMINCCQAFIIIYVNINNQVTEPFELHEGVLQGCPLAP